LIFYSSTYYDKSPFKKYQRHDLTHVEIFLGGKTGTMSVASRSSKGLVSIYNDFRFKSGNYYNVRHHFRSLDTWLSGILKSCCDVHIGKSLS